MKRRYFPYIPFSMHRILTFALILSFSGMATPSASKAFAPAEDSPPTGTNSAQEGLFPAMTRFSPESLNRAMASARRDAIGDSVQSAINLLNSRIEKNGSEFVSDRVRPDKRGNTQVRVMQRYRGIRVVGAEMNIIVNRDKAVVVVSGHFAPGLTVGVKPKLSPEDALKKIGDDSGNDHDVIDGPDLVIYGGKLAYSITVSAKDKSPSRWRYYVDGHSGDVLSKYNDIKYQSPSLK